MSINVLLIVFVFIALGKVIDGYKKGVVKEIISLVSLVVLCAVIILLAAGFHNYQSGNMVNVIIAGVLLAALGIAHHLLGVVFFSAKILSKLPVIHLADKLLGCVFGLLETVVMLWLTYMLNAILDLGAVGSLISSCTAENSLLTRLYQNNYLVYLLQRFMPEIEYIKSVTMDML